MTDQSPSSRLKKFGLLAVTAIALAGLGAAAAPAPPPVAPTPAASVRPATDADIAFFEAKVRPLFLKQCVACHSSKIAQGSLRLDDPAAMLKGGTGVRWLLLASRTRACYYTQFASRSRI